MSVSGSVSPCSPCHSADAVGGCLGNSSSTGCYPALRGCGGSRWFPTAREGKGAPVTSLLMACRTAPPRCSARLLLCRKAPPGAGSGQSEEGRQGLAGARSPFCPQLLGCSDETLRTQHSPRPRRTGAGVQGAGCMPPGWAELAGGAERGWQPWGRRETDAAEGRDSVRTREVASMPGLPRSHQGIRC